MIPMVDNECLVHTTFVVEMEVPYVVTVHLSKKSWISTITSTPSYVFLTRLCNPVTASAIPLLKLYLIGAWKFSWKTAKKLNLDRTQTCQDRKFRGLGKTITVVQSSVYLNFQIFEDQERPVYLRSTSLSTFEIQAFLVHNIILHTTRYKISLSLWQLSNEERDMSIKWMYNLWFFETRKDWLDQSQLVFRASSDSRNLIPGTTKNVYCNRPRVLTCQCALVSLWTGGLELISVICDS